MGQDYQKSQCLKDANTSEQHSQCFNTQRMSFEEYEEQRKKIADK